MFDKREREREKEVKEAKVRYDEPIKIRFATLFVNDFKTDILRCIHVVSCIQTSTYTHTHAHTHTLFNSLYRVSKIR